MVTRRAAFALILFLAVLPLTVVGAVIFFFAARGHEGIIEAGLEAVTGLPVDLEGLESIDLERFKIEKASIGENLFTVDSLEVTCQLNPFILKSLTIRDFRFDCGGANSGKLLRMLEFIQQREQPEEFEPFSINIDTITACIPIPGTYPEKLETLYGGPITLISKNGRLSHIRFSEISIPGGKQNFSGEAVYDISTRSGTVSFTGHMDLINRFLISYVSFTENPLYGKTVFARDNNGDLTVSATVMDTVNTNEYEARLFFPGKEKAVHVEAFRTNLRKAGPVMKFFPQFEIISLSGEEMLSRGSVFFSDSDPGFRISWYIDINKPVVSFKSNIDAGDQVFKLSEIPPYHAETFISKSDFTLRNPEKGEYTLTVHSATGTMEGGTVFWDIEGALRIKEDEAVSDITAYLYEVPLSSMRGLFTALGLKHYWFEVARGPVDIHVKHFDISKPSKVPIILSSGSKGLDFWITDSLPRMEGIILDDVKIYLPETSSESTVVDTGSK